MAAQPEQLLFRDDFTEGLRVGEGAPWRLRPVDAMPAGDGAVRTVPEGLLVVPTGVNPDTGEPAFADPETGPNGAVQHLRWAAFTTHTSPSGRPGFDAAAGQVLMVSAELAVRGLGLERHPCDVSDPGAGIQLGAVGLISVDLETGIVFDFFLTNDHVFAVYERLALRPDAQFAAFSYAVPVTDRKPDQVHHLEIAFDRAAAMAHWQVDGGHVLSVDRIGFRTLDHAYLLRDNGGREEAVLPRQFTYGMGLFADRMCGQGIELSARWLRVSASPPVR